MTVVKQLVEFIDKLAPFGTAEDWDNSGLLVGDDGREVSGVLVALDATPQVVEEAERLGCSLIITHHPVIFQPIKRLHSGSVPYMAAQRGIAILSAHTNLDKAARGVNTALAEKLELGETRAFLEGDEFGICGKLETPMQPEEFAKLLHSRLGLAPRFNPLGRTIQTVGICGGAGADLLQDAIGIGIAPDAFVTADVKHHEYIAAAAHGVTLYDCGHYATEAVVIPRIVKELQCTFPALRIAPAAVYNGELL